MRAVSGRYPGLQSVAFNSGHPPQQDRASGLGWLRRVWRPSLSLSLSDLVETGAVRKKAKGPAKYRNPADPTQTWTGRGRHPQWVIDDVKRGASLEYLAINLRGACPRTSTDSCSVQRQTSGRMGSNRSCGDAAGHRHVPPTTPSPSARSRPSRQALRVATLSPIRPPMSCQPLSDRQGRSLIPKSCIGRGAFDCTM